MTVCAPRPPALKTSRLVVPVAEPVMVTKSVGEESPPSWVLSAMRPPCPTQFPATKSSLPTALLRNEIMPALLNVPNWKDVMTVEVAPVAAAFITPDDVFVMLSVALSKWFVAPAAFHVPLFTRLFPPADWTACGGAIAGKISPIVTAPVSTPVFVIVAGAPPVAMASAEEPELF